MFTTMSKTKTKDLCERCGRCCRIKRQFGNLYVALDEYCPQFFLDNGKGACKIYGKHTGTVTGRVLCLSAEQTLEAALFPNDCPYAKRKPGYRTLVVNY